MEPEKQTSRLAAEPRRVDRRIERTRRLLREALVALVLERGYDSVTVQELVAHASLSRATFYLHYRDKDDLLMHNLRDDFEAILDQIAQSRATTAGAESAEHKPPDGMAMLPSPSLIVFRYAAQNRDFYRQIIRSQYMGKFSEQMRVSTAEQFIAGFSERAQHPPHIPLDVIAQHYAASLIGLLNWWVESDMQYEAEQMESMFLRLNAGLIPLLGLEPPPPRQGE